MAVYYISPTGNDSTGTGVLGNPWATISKAVSSSSGGDTINCLAGTYTWAAQDPVGNRNIVGVSGAAATIFDGGGSHLIFWRGEGSVTGITFQNADAGSSGADYLFGTTVGTGATWKFTNCIFISLQAVNTGSIFSSGSGSVGIIGTMDFTACVFVNCSKNIASPGGNSGIFSPIDGSAIFTITNCTFYTNIIAADTNIVMFGGSLVAGSTTLMTLINNIFVNANGTPVAFDFQTTHVTYAGTNNDFFGHSSPPSLPNQLTVDPLFVNPASNNFNLRPTSPCIDAGTPI